MKKIRRNFLKHSIGFLTILILTKPFINSKNYIKKKIKVYKKKYTKIWILDVDDS
jgi:hypothetical protein